MKSKLYFFVYIPILFLILLPTWILGQQAEGYDIQVLIESLEFDLPVHLDVRCTPVPEGKDRFLALAIFKNQPPIRPDNPNFPVDFCAPDARFYARAEGEGKSTHLGGFKWSEQYCALGGYALAANGYFEATNGDRLNWDATVQAEPVPPPFPDATFVGEMTFTGGTGRFVNASGTARIAAQQLGDAPASNIPGSTAASVCGWINIDVTQSKGNK